MSGAHAYARGVELRRAHRARRAGARGHRHPGWSSARPRASPAPDLLALQRSLGNRAVSALLREPGQTPSLVQRAGPEAFEHEIERRKSGEGFDRLEQLRQQADAQTTVRLVVRSAALGEAGAQAGVGHAAIQASIVSATAGAEAHAQLGLDNGGLVKMEGAATEELISPKYRLTFLERQIDRDTALRFLTKLRGEVGKKHSYLEKLHPGSYYLGYENCTSWAEDMAAQAGLSLPKPGLADIKAFYPRPFELAARLRAGQVAGGHTLTTVDVLGGHRIAGEAARQRFEQRSALAAAGNKWLFVASLLEDLKNRRAKRNADQLGDDLGVEPPSEVDYAAISAAADSVFAGEKVDLG